MSVPTLGMGQRRPLGELREIAICLRPQQQVPMIGHQTMRKNPHVVAITGFSQDALEGGVVLVAFKDGQASIRARFST